MSSDILAQVASHLFMVIIGLIAAHPDRDQMERRAAELNRQAAP